MNRNDRDKLIKELNILKSGIQIKINDNDGNEFKMEVYKNQLKIVNKCINIVHSQTDKKLEEELIEYEIILS